MSVNKNNNEHEFDAYADTYRDIHTNNVKGLTGKGSSYFSEYKIRELSHRKILSRHKKVKVLDLGCGDGISCGYFKKYNPNVIYTGIDISENSITKASSTYGAKYFQVYDGKNIPFEDGTLDIVYIACVMHHIPVEDRQEIIKECYRVLKPGGKIIIFEHNSLNPLTMKAVNTCEFDDGVTLVKKKQAEEYLNNAGFVDILSRYTIFMPRTKVFSKLIKLERFMGSIPFGGQYYIVGRKK